MWDSRGACCRVIVRVWYPYGYAERGGGVITEDERNTARVNLRLPKSTLAVIAELAKAKDKTVAGFIRDHFQDMRPHLDELLLATRAADLQQVDAAFELLVQVAENARQKADLLDRQVAEWRVMLARAEADQAEAVAAQPGGTPAAPPQGAGRAGQG